IDMVGDGVPPARMGERVWVWNGQWKRAFGTCAQYVVLPSGLAPALPAQASFEAGACLGIPAMTAYHAVAVANVGKGSNVVISGTGSAEATIPAQPSLVNAIKIEFIFVYELTTAEREAAVSAISRMLASNALINNVALTLPLEEIVAAHEAVEQGKTMGNV